MKINNSIKAICFDLDGVYFTGKGKSAFHQALVGLVGDEDRVRAFMYSKEVGEPMPGLVRGTITPEDFLNEMREALDLRLNNQEIASLWVKEYEIDDNVRAVVQKVKSAGYKTCVCTNNNAIRLGALNAMFPFWRDDFDVVLSSHEVGYVKPQVQIYRELINQLGIEPSELIYSDDNENRLGGARDIGINVFVFENFEQFLRELRGFGVAL